MSDQQGGGVRIGRLHVRLPGGSPERANGLATQLQRSLAADTLARSARLSRVDLKVSVPHGAPPELVAEAIARALRRRLR
jgi:hypothetical protein